MKIYRSILALLLSAFPLVLSAQNGPQLYNMGFDNWCKTGGVWRLYAKDASASQRIWDSANPGLSKLRVNSTTPEYEHVAVKGEGEAAARIESKKVPFAFVAGNVFSGRYVRLVDLSGVETELGAPFTSRPKALSGWYHYIPRKINYTDEPYDDMKGKTDEALIEVLLMDWEKPRKQISNVDGFINSNTDPHIIGRARLVVTRATSGYVHFEIPFEYRNGKTPRYVSVAITSSRLGGYNTGASGSVLYVDEFEFKY
ncbi:MAG: PCMD domain-containing protein [Bacteroidales bacterium]|nr:PCMD domain-containing protein [Bacteroidales bacterium]